MVYIIKTGSTLKGKRKSFKAVLLFKRGLIDRNTNRKTQGLSSLNKIVENLPSVSIPCKLPCSNFDDNVVELQCLNITNATDALYSVLIYIATAFSEMILI